MAMVFELELDLDIYLDRLLNFFEKLPPTHQACVPAINCVGAPVIRRYHQSIPTGLRWRAGDKGI
jgi:hypothetical protein